MKYGVVYPQTEYGSDPAAIKDYAQQAEDLGYNHVLVYDHILGANPDTHPDLVGPYRFYHTFQSPLLLFSFMAAVTERLEFTTGIIILPQRETALFAKQAATLDVLSGGRLRLGLGIGWNPVEYTSLSQDFSTRGKRIEEQVEVLRLLWTQLLVKYKGRWHDIPDAGINPLPVQQPIPIWFGGHAEAVLRRTAMMADGWMPNYRRAADAQRTIQLLDQFLAQAGRNREELGIEARIHYGEGDPEEWSARVREWEAAGATHISFNTMASGFETPAEHLLAISRMANELGVREQTV